jgi:nucleoside 2-deoxyribosyltransferase
MSVPNRTIYVASKSEHGPFWRKMRTNMAMFGGFIVSTWIDERDDEPASTEDLWVRRIEEASRADCVLAFHKKGEQWKGTYVEIGAALAHGKPVFLVGDPLGSWVNHPNVHRISNALEVLTHEVWKDETWEVEP